MKYFATANWTCVAIATIGLCGCSSMGGKWWWQKKDDSIASRPPALPYAPDKPLANSSTAPSNSSSAVAGSSSSGATGYSASTAGAPAAYPSTGYNMPASYTPPSTAGGYTPPPASRANAWAPSNNASAYPGAGSSSPAATGPSATAIGTQNGLYQGAYPNAVAAAPANTNSTPNYPAANYPNPNAVAVPSTSGATPWVASAPGSNDTLRTADARSGQPATEVSFAQRSWTPAPSAASATGNSQAPPWGTNGVPQDTTSGEKAAAYNDPNNGGLNVSPAGGDVRSFGSPRKDPYFRPGSTKDFAPTTGTSPPAALLPSQPSARAESVTPANYTGNSTANYALNETVERANTNAASLAAPWNAAVAGNSFTPPTAMVETLSRYPAPSPFDVAPGSTDATANKQYGGGSDVQSNGHVEVSVGGGFNAIRR